MEWYIFALISAIFSALAAILEKKILFKEKALEFTVILALFNLVIASFFFFRTDFQTLSLPGLGILLFKSFLNALAFLFVMYSIKKLELSETLPMLALTPGFVAIFAFIFLGESLSSLEIIGLALLVIGIYIHGLDKKQGLLKPFRTFFSSKNKYILLALSLFTLTSILDKLILSRFKFSPDAFMAFQHVFFALIFIFIFISLGGKFKGLKSTAYLSGILIFVLAIITVIYRYAEIMAVKNSASVALVIALKRTSVFFAVLIGGKIFKDHHLVRRLIATAFLVAGAAMIIN
ncbi:MAG: EamA family transporter [archaeon]